MQFCRNKTLAIVLAISIGAMLLALPAANAHTPPYQIPTHAYITANPDPIGVGQSVGIYMWLDQIFGVGYDQTSFAQLTNNYRFRNYNLTIIKPNNQTETKIFDTISDPTSSLFFRYTPDQTGTYTLLFSFPGQAYAQYPGAYNPVSILVNDTYLASSASTKLVVQQEAIPDVGSSPLPTEYWARPIYGESTDWWAISSNWLGTGSPVISATGSGDITAFTTGPPVQIWGSVMQRYPGDAIGPLTGHIMWTKPLQFGGVVGGTANTPSDLLGNTWFEGSAYNQRYTNPIIISGILYYTEPVSFTGTNAGPTVAVDLRTGENLWRRSDVPALSFGYIYDVEDPNQHGVFPAILFATSGFVTQTWRAFDAFTGNPLFNVTNVPIAYEALGLQGEHLRYVLANAGTSANPDWRLGQWNSSRLWDFFTVGFSPSIPSVADGSISTGPNSRYDWNVTIPWRNTMTPAPTILAAFYNNMLLLSNGTFPAAPSSFSTPSSTPYTYFAVNLNASRGPIGQVMWTNTVNAPAGNLTVYYAGADPTVNVFIETYKETVQWVGYNLLTGQKMWGPTDPQTALTPLDYYGQPGPAQPYAQVAYGKLYTSGYGGVVYAYDLETGDILWSYGNGGPGNSTDSGFQVPGHYPTFINAVGNGVIYLVSTEHTVQTPIYKGALARAINATDGKEIWALSAYTGEFLAQSYAIADGFSTFFNGYDNQIYSVGRGPSATTVMAPPVATPLKAPVVISGTVMDISAGTRQKEQAARFPNGVAAVSDASMKDWMGYVYQQKAFPTDCSGVEVTLSVLDSNNNLREIGKATSDVNGFYSFEWIPDIPGKFTVFAKFAGSAAYWPSFAEAAFTVYEAPQITIPEPQAQPDMTGTIALAAAAIIIAMAIIGAVIVLLLRRR